MVAQPEPPNATLILPSRGRDVPSRRVRVGGGSVVAARARERAIRLLGGEVEDVHEHLSAQRREPRLASVHLRHELQLSVDIVGVVPVLVSASDADVARNPACGPP